MAENEIILNEEQNASNDIAIEENAVSANASDQNGTTIVVSELEDTVMDNNNRTIHNNLYGREAANAHPISAIGGLREELDGLNTTKTPQVLYSNEFGTADYYEWADGHKYDDYGYFVSVKPGTTQIKICEGADIFGVTVNRAGFIGGYQKDGYGNTHALVATSGLVDVRCASGVNAGDYVICNQSGLAVKSTTNYGYKVTAVERNVNTGVEYATIILDIPADQIETTNVYLQNALDRLSAAEHNIIAAMTTAQDAYNKSVETSTSNSDVSNKVDSAIEYIDNKATEIDNKATEIDQDISYITGIANDAVATAQSIKDDAVKTANDAWDEANKATEGVEKLSTLSEELLTYTKQNESEIASLVTSIDKYSVGEYSQSYGLTVAQARNILKEGMVYIPTPHGGNLTHIESYIFVDNDGKSDTIEKSFTYGNFYMWESIKYTYTSPDGNEIDMSGYWWKEYTSRVFRSTIKVPEVADNDTADYYWYIDGEAVIDLKEQGYESYALYFWTGALDAEDNSTGKSWQKVNTLAGNVNNRMTSMIRQSVDEIGFEVLNPRGSMAAMNAKLTETEARANMVAEWKADVEGDVSNIATIESKADAAGASISQVVETIGSDGVVTAASIVTAINNDESAIKIQADHIEIDGAQINLTADQITAVADQVTLEGKVSVNGTFAIDEEGYMSAIGGTIGGWNISKNGIIATNDKAGMLSSGSSVRFFAGESLSIQEELTTTETISILPKMIYNDASGNWCLNYTPKFISENGVMRQITNAEKIETKLSGDVVISIASDKQWITIIMSEEPTPLATVKVEFTYNEGLRDFMVHEDGSLYANNAHITGEITATSGSIGAWSIGTIPNKDENNKPIWGNAAYINSLYSISQAEDEEEDAKDYLTFLRVPETSDGHVFSIRMKDANDNVTIPFSISKNGKLTTSGESGKFQSQLSDGDLSLWADEQRIGHLSGKGGDTNGRYLGLILDDGAGIALGIHTSSSSMVPYYILNADDHSYSGYSERHIFQDKVLYMNGARLRNGTVISGYLKDETADPVNMIYVRPEDYLCVGDSKIGLYLWGTTIYANNTSISTGSDYNIKNSIEVLPDKYETFLDNLEPVRFKYNEGTSGRYHTGYIAQDVEAALAKAEIDTTEFAGFIRMEDGQLALGYSEFIALLHQKIKRLEQRIVSLENIN